MLLLKSNNNTYADNNTITTSSSSEKTKNNNSEITVFALHGQMKMQKRQAIHKQVTKRNRCVLVCTDVAARGLDIP